MNAHVSVPNVRLGGNWIEGVRLAGKVHRREKWATSYPHGLFPLPVLGQEIAIDAAPDGRSVKVRVTGVGVCRMSEVRSDFAAAEGHYCLADWRRVHAEFYRQMGVEEDDPKIVQVWLNPC